MENFQRAGVWWESGKGPCRTQPLSASLRNESEILLSLKLEDGVTSRYRGTVCTINMVSTGRESASLH